jgi:peptidoglycan/xylan/chitin deacetylase (PgdA/CDA1 family)
LSLHRVTLVLGIGAAFAILLLPPGWRVCAWTSLVLLVFALVTWGVVSIRSPYFGRALLGGSSRDSVALTFDDGPDPVCTPALLDLLKSRGVRATFFVVGERVRAHPELVRRCQAEGHELGNHSHSHSPWLNFRLRRGMQLEIAACQDAIEATTGRRPRWYRPPVGLRNPAVHPACAALGLRVVGWQVRSLDKSGRAPDAIAERVLRHVRPGGIVLLHDGGQTRERLLAITDGILRGLETRGLRAVTLGQLLGTSGPARG